MSSRNTKPVVDQSAIIAAVLAALSSSGAKPVQQQASKVSGKDYPKAAIAGATVWDALAGGKEDRAASSGNPRRFQTTADGYAITVVKTSK